MIDQMKTADRLRKYRVENKKTITGLANTLGITDYAVYKWERGMAMPSLDHMVTLSEIYNVDINKLIVRRK